MWLVIWNKFVSFEEKQIIQKFFFQLLIACIRNLKAYLGIDV